MKDPIQLSRREREIMDIIYSRGTATATEVLEQMTDEPNRATVRTLLRILEEKGHLSHSKKGREFVYVPSRPRERVGQSAFQRVLRTFFDGSLEKAVAAHLADPGAELSANDLERLTTIINAAKRKGKQK
jgi:BlaI family penicillinase repressor